jgi:hypothetical protein
MGNGGAVETITTQILHSFLQRLSQRYTGSGTLYLLGGCALCLLGNPRTTQDIDYMVEMQPEALSEFQSTMDDLAAEMHLDLEVVPLAEFIPLPPQAQERCRLVGHYGQLDVYLFDPYSIALSKIARGFETDLEDVLFMLRQGLIAFTELENHFNAILPYAVKTDIIPSEFRDYFEEVRRRCVDGQGTR